MSPVEQAVQIHQIYIKAEPDRIWEAITSPEWNGRYGYGGISHYELRPGGKFSCVTSEAMRSYGAPEFIADGEVIEVNPPYKLVQSYRSVIAEAMIKEGFMRITYEIEKTSAGFCRLTLTHDTGGAPIMARVMRSNFSEDGGGGWGWILSDLKSLLETGKRMSD